MRCWYRGRYDCGHESIAISATYGEFCRLEGRQEGSDRVAIRLRTLAPAPVQYYHLLQPSKYL